ncbi:hypothetical protein CRYUN_Cryun23aG0002100 [Craigia yunnanensis]
MILPWKKRTHNKKNKKQLCDDLDVEVIIPTHFRCPISLDLMKDPVTLCTGITYDRESIDRWIEAGNETCPVTKQVLKTFYQIPNHILRRMIQEWCVDNRSQGVERIPTPRIPVSPYQVSEVCSRIVGATQRGDGNKCEELVRKIKNWCKESERNKRCILENGTSCTLSACFQSFASVSSEKHINLLGEILSVLSCMIPFGEENRSMLGSESSLRCIIWFLKSGDLSARQNAVLVLKELLYSDERQAITKTLLEIEGAVETLVYLIREPISPTATKASLMAIYYMISSTVNNNKITSRFLETGLVSVILEIIVEAEKSICEKALSVLDAICNTEQGKKEAYKNALIMPLLLKKILRVSDSATELSLSVFWKLCKERMKDEEGVIIEAIQVGAIQKLLVILQVGCGESTKGKVTELLKLLYVYKNRVDCVDSSMDFKKRKQKGFDDCKDCFDLEGREKTRWTSKKSVDGLDFAIDEVLATRKPGTIRIGLDIGGGVATFAVIMMERNITIVTTSMNLNGPFNNFIASRGVVPLYISISQRLPFFDNTLDIVHSMHVLSNWIPTRLLHFLLFDIYRVLRPGGLFWLDHFFCVGEQLKEVYAPLIESVGFNKLKWVVGRKLDHGPELREMYLSALLEKPLNNSW